MARGANATVVNFGVGQAGQDATQWELWDQAAGGTLLWKRNLQGNPPPLVGNQFFQIEAGTLIVEVPEGTEGAQAAAALRAVRGILAGTTFVQLLAADETVLTNRVALDLAGRGWTIT